MYKSFLKMKAFFFSLFCLELNANIANYKVNFSLGTMQ